MDMKEWLDDVAPSVNAAAIEIGMTTSTLARQLASKDGLPAETVIRIARAYSVPAVEALVQLGFLEADEVDEGIARLDISAALSRASERDLLREIGLRLDAKNAGPRETPPAPTKPKPGASLPTVAEQRRKRTYPKPATEAARDD